MPHGIRILASITYQRGCLSHLDLSQCGMDAGALSTLLTALLQKPSVLSLDVSNQPLSSAGAQELADFLRVDKKLQILRARRISLPSYCQGEMLELSKAL